jgi:hypothetical protein
MLVADVTNSQPDIPDYQAIGAHKLYDAAWRQYPERLDAVIYRELLLKQQSESEVRAMVKQWFDATDPVNQDENEADIRRREDEIEANVANILKEKAAPRRMIHRIRIDGDRHRIDEVILAPTCEDIRNVKLSHAYVWFDNGATTRDGYTSFEYVGDGRAARILPDLKFGGTPVVEWIQPPYVNIVRLIFGRPSEEKKQLVPDEEALSKYIKEGGMPVRGISFKIVPDRDSDGLDTGRDRVEFFSGSPSEGRITMMAIVDRRDYARAYWFEAYAEPGSKQVRVLKQVDSYDNNGMPVAFRLEQYDGNGKLIDADSVAFLKLTINPSLPDDVFEFTPPPGYSMIDTRAGGRILQEGRETALEAGESLLDMLGKDAFGPDGIPKLVNQMPRFDFRRALAQDNRPSASQPGQ